MYMDANLLMSNSQASWDGGTLASTSYIDTLAAGNAMAPGARWVVQTNVSMTAASGSPTMTIALQTATDTAFTSPVTLVATAALTPAGMLATTVLADMVIPNACLRYLRTYYTVGGSGGFASTGSLISMIVLDSDVTIDGLL